MRNTMFGTMLIVLLLSSVAHGGEWTMQLDVQGQTIEGKLLDYSDQQVFLLGRDGRLWDFAPSDSRNYRKTAPYFRSYSQSEMRWLLLKEFGRDFDVSGTGHYLVVHPAGQRDQWAERFEELYRSFVHYFSTRGGRIQSPPFPLVAVVLPSRTHFLKYAANEGVSFNGSVVGYFSRESNRIVMYDQTDGGNQNWQENALTIIHEVTHQSAFNLGIHNRFAPQPAWIVEGLGTMFEARGVWDSRRWPQQSERVNRQQLNDFRRYAADGRPRDSLVQLISSDRKFDINPRGAYAEAWALSFYLAETQPQRYFRYMAHIASRPAFIVYNQQERLKDFTDAFGSDFAMLDAQLLRFIDRLE